MGLVVGEHRWIRTLRPALPAILLCHGLQAITIGVLALMAPYVQNTAESFLG
ncbi:hypothetical protein [Amycolatopsis taiwanensis]|nr:hypothetical protein [Amycolatopsis taiwanensis]